MTPAAEQKPRIYAPALKRVGGDFLVDSNIDRRSVRKINIQGAIISAPVTIADVIENSFNTLAKHDVDPSVKELLSQLVQAVTKASKTAPPEVAETMQRDVATLCQEVASPKPRRKWYEVSIESLVEAAKKMADVGKPILEIADKLLPLLLKQFP